MGHRAFIPIFGEPIPLLLFNQFEIEMVGKTLSHYKILEELGRGGMGIVYKAEDLKLRREVAIKVLPAAALSSPDDRERFYREARSAAQLQHPNIAAVFEIDESVPSDGDEAEPRLFIAMEYIAGESLHERMKDGPLKLKVAVDIATQIAEALKAAHAKEIVHRDIKSANVMITEDGVAKVLDFGLAKTNASTMLTRQGSTLGTVAYMSPEQARGEEVDGRSDLYSLGTVFFEMIAGHVPFDGEYEQAVVYGILNENPEPLTAIRTGVPQQLEWVVHKLLSKDREYRYQTAADLVADLKTVELGGSGHTRRAIPVADSSAVQSSSQTGTSHVSRMPRWGWPLVVGSLLLGALGMWVLNPGLEMLEKPVIHTTLDVIEGDAPPYTLAVSPSGKMLAYSDDTSVFVRDLKTDDEWQIPETGGARRVIFTPDENWLFIEIQGAILRSPVRGGTPFQIASVAATYPTVNFAPNGDIVYESGGTIYRQNLSGGEPVVVVAPDSTFGFLDDPNVTADGKYLIAVQISDDNSQNLAVYDFESGGLIGSLDIDGRKSIYLDSGHLIYTSAEMLMFAVPVDLESATILSPPVPIGRYADQRAMSVSSQGHFFYAEQNPSGISGFANRQIHRVNWDGTESTLPPQQSMYSDLSLSPTGDRIAIDLIDGTEDLWVVDVRSGVRQRMTANNSGLEAAWHPSGDSLIYADRSIGHSLLYIRAADGSGLERVLYQIDGHIYHPRPNADGSKILFEGFLYSTGRVVDIWEFDTRTGSAAPVIGGQGPQGRPSYSPDGAYVLYDGPGADGELHVWMQPSTFDGSRQDVSKSPGFDARWSHDGDAIYYRWERDLFRVSVDVSNGSMSLSNPEIVISSSDNMLEYDLLPDGSGILTVKAGTLAEQETEKRSDGLIHVIYNWTEYLEELVPIPD